MCSIVTELGGLALAACTMLAMGAAGMPLVSGLVRNARTRTMRFAAGFAASYLVLTTLVLLAGLAGALNRALYLMLAMITVLAAAYSIRFLSGRERTDETGSEPKGPKTSRQNRYALALVLLGCAFLLRCLGSTLMPETGPDALSYHLALPRWFNDSGRILSSAHMYPSNYPLSFEMIVCFFDGLGLPEAAGCFHFCLGVLLALLVFDEVHKKRGMAAGACAFVFVTSMPLFGWLCSTANNDFASTLFLALSVLVLMGEDQKDARAVWAGGLAAGLAVGVKLYMAAYIPPLLLILFVMERRRAGSATALKHGAMFLAAALLPVLPWMIKNALLKGNPFYPFLLGVFPIDPLEGAFLQWIRYRLAVMYAPIGSAADLALVPWNLFARPELFGHLSLGWLLLPVSLLALWTAIRRPALRPVLYGVVLLFLIWITQTRQSRLLLPLYILACAGGAAAIAEIAKGSLRLKAAPLLGAVLLCLLAASNWPDIHSKIIGRWVLLPELDPAVLCCRKSPEVYLRGHFTDGSFEAHQWMNANLPGNALVLSLENADHFHAGRPMIDSSHSPVAWDILRDVLEARSAKAIEKMNGAGITHVLAPRKWEGELGAGPLEQNLLPLQRTAGFTVYRLTGNGRGK